jgi:hypothetical protein
MQIDVAGQAALYKLVEVDLELNHIKSQLQELIDSAELKTAQAEMTSSAELLLTARTEFENLQTSVRRSEEDIRLVTDRLVRDRDRLNATSSPKDAIGIQGEIESLTRRKDELESIELELLEQLEQAQKALDVATTARTTSGEKLNTIQGALAEEIEAVKVRGRKATADRAILVAKVPAEVMAKYENLASKQVAVGKIIDRACSACHMVISSTAIDKLAALPEDEIGNCPECLALIVR